MFHKFLNNDNKIILIVQLRIFRFGLILFFASKNNKNWSEMIKIKENYIYTIVHSKYEVGNSTTMGRGISNISDIFKTAEVFMKISGDFNTL